MHTAPDCCRLHHHPRQFVLAARIAVKACVPRWSVPAGKKPPTWRRLLRCVTDHAAHRGQALPANVLAGQARTDPAIDTLVPVYPIHW